MAQAAGEQYTLPEPEQIRQAAQEVIQRSEYDLSRADSESSMRLLEKIAEFIRDLFRPFSSALDSLHNASPLAWWIVVILLILLLIAMVTHIIWSIYRAFRRKQQFAAPEEETDSRETAPDYWEERARHAAESRDYVSAMRFLLQSSLMHLEHAASNRLRRGATNREYLRKYNRTPALQPLQVMVDMVDAKWYGEKPCHPQDYNACAEAHQTICRIARERASQNAPSA